MGKVVFKGILGSEDAPVQLATEPGLNATSSADSSVLQTTRAFARISENRAAPGNPSKSASNPAGRHLGFGSQDAELLAPTWERFERVFAQGRFLWMQGKEQAGGGTRENTAQILVPNMLVSHQRNIVTNGF
jgi:hypothetical protein